VYTNAKGGDVDGNNSYVECDEDSSVQVIFAIGCHVIAIITLFLLWKIVCNLDHFLFNNSFIHSGNLLRSRCM